MNCMSCTDPWEPLVCDTVYVFSSWLRCLCPVCVTTVCVWCLCCLVFNPLLSPTSFLVVELTDASVASAFTRTPPPLAPLPPTTIAPTISIATTSSPTTTTPTTTINTTTITTSTTTPSTTTTTTTEATTTTTPPVLVTTKRIDQNVLGTSCSPIVDFTELQFNLCVSTRLSSPTWRNRKLHLGCIPISCAVPALQKVRDYFRILGCSQRISWSGSENPSFFV